MTNLLLAWLQYGVIGVSWTLLGAIGVYAYLCKMLNEDYRKIFNEWLEESNSEFWSSASTKQKFGQYCLRSLLPGLSRRQ